jgi:hypothetical protein
MLGRLCDVNLRMLGGNQAFLADHECYLHFFDSAELWYDFYTCIPSSTDCWVCSNRETWGCSVRCSGRMFYVQVGSHVRHNCEREAIDFHDTRYADLLCLYCQYMPSVPCEVNDDWDYCLGVNWVTNPSIAWYSGRNFRESS